MLDADHDRTAPVTDWLTGPYQQRSDRAGYARDLLARGSWDRPQLASILTASLDARGAPALARQGAARLGEGGVVAVVSGQQPAVGGGPLFCLVKAAHSILVARELSADGIPAVPVFWCASEDHDLGEAGHADLVHRDGRIQRVAGELPTSGASLRHQPVSAWWEQLVTALTTVDGSLGRDWWLAHAPHPDEMLGTWACRIMEQLFAAHGLVVVEAHQLRPLMRDGFTRALVEAWPTEAITRHHDLLKANGHGLPLGDLTGPPLFSDTSAGRVALDGNAAKALLAADPSALSPGAGLRPVVQQLALPAACYCAGPGEIAYHAQLTPVYPALQAVPPLLVPRVQASIVPAWLGRACTAWGIAPADLLQANPPPGELAQAQDQLQDLDTALAALEARAQASSDQDVSRRLRTGLARLHRERERLAASLARGHRQALQRPALGTLHAWLRPRGGPQERTLSLAQAVWAGGPGLIPSLMTRLADASPGSHHLIEL